MSSKVILETNRLRLREWRTSDARPYEKHCNTPAVMHWLDGVQPLGDVLDEVDWFIRDQEKNGFTFWVMERKQDGAFLGFCGLIRVRERGCPIDGELEIGWRLRKDEWRNGYTYEAALTVLDYAFTVLREKEVFSRVSRGNIASWQLMIKLGMRDRPTLLHRPEGEDEDLNVCSICKP